MSKVKKIFTVRRALVLLFLAICVLISCISLKGSYLEYKELGEKYISIFWTNIKYKYYVMLGNFIFLYLVMYFNGRRIKKDLKVFFEEEKKEMPRLPNKSISLVISVLVSIAVAIIFTPKIILCASNASFAQTDPIFKLDISFYMFFEPIVKMAIIYIMSLIIGLTVYSGIYHVVVFNKYFDGIDRETLKKSSLMKQIFRNIRIFAIALAVYTLVSTLDIVFGKFITTNSDLELNGAGLVETTIKLWGNIIFAIILIISIWRAVTGLKKNEMSKTLKRLIVIPAYLVCMFILMVGFDFIFVRTNEYDNQESYIKENISATKKAYGINFDINTLNYSGTISVDEVNENKEIVDNTAIVNPKLVLKNLNETQTQTGYYTYSTAHLSKYNVDGENRYVYVSPREILSSQRAYNSKTYEYTHGYGLILTSATNMDEAGNIKYIQNDITGNDSMVNINTPQIYYGMETNSTIITNAKGKNEYDYTDNSGVEYMTNYEGDSGLKLNALDRIILGLEKKDIGLAFSGNATKESKILINRNIIERAKLALPNVVYDKEPYTVVDDNGDIYWVLDAYTTSTSYPYSNYTTIVYNNQRITLNYIKNSIKVIINAYDGNMKFYITDRDDPIAMGYAKMYPELFEDKDSQIDESISKNFTYPKFLYEVQSALLGEYHNIKPDVLYRDDDSWEKAKYNTNTSSKKNATTLDSYYTVLNDGNIGLVQIYTPKDKQNIISYLVGTVEEGKNKLTINRFNSDTTILGPTQLDNQISQNEEIKNELDSLNVSGVEITKDMIIVPINDTILYVEPIYQTRRNEENIPVLSKVVVASGSKVSIGNNLQEAITNLISQYATNIDINTTDDIEGIIESIIKANGNLSNSIDSKNLELMGSDIQKLQDLINTLDKKRREVKKDKDNNDTKNIITEQNTTNIINENNITENNIVK